MTGCQPNIVIIMTDQQRRDTLGCYGNAFTPTPCLDRLAGEGVRFENCFTPLSLCTPARATMWTGALPHQHRIWSNVYGIDDVLAEVSPCRETVFDRLRAAGYETAYVGKWHLGERAPACFDHWDGFNSMVPHWRDGVVGGEYLPDGQTDRFNDFLRARAGADRPFVAVNSYYPPHDMVYPPGERALFTAPEPFYRQFRDRGLPFPGYYASIANLDWNIGRTLDCLAETGLRRRTVVVFCSDHGEHFHARNRGHKASCTDDSIRVPLLVSAPGGRSGAVAGELVGLEDIFAAMLAWAGLAVPAGAAGRPLPGTGAAVSTPARDCYYIENIDPETRQPQRAIRTAGWKLILNQWPLTVQNYEVGNRLYDLAQDPEEDINLYHQERCRGELAGLIDRLAACARAAADGEGAEIAARARAGLRHAKAGYRPLAGM